MLELEIILVFMSGIHLRKAVETTKRLQEAPRHSEAALDTGISCPVVLAVTEGYFYEPPIGTCVTRLDICEPPYRYEFVRDYRSNF